MRRLKTFAIVIALLSGSYTGYSLTTGHDPLAETVGRQGQQAARPVASRGRPPATATPAPKAPTAVGKTAPALARQPAAPVAAPTPAPTTTPPPSEGGSPLPIMVVGNTDGIGVYVRRTPHMTDRLRAWVDGTRMEILQRGIQAEGRSWAKVRSPDGAEGYVPEAYLVERR